MVIPVAKQDRAQTCDAWHSRNLGAVRARWVRRLRVLIGVISMVRLQSPTTEDPMASPPSKPQPPQAAHVSASEFKANCLEIIDDIEHTGRDIVVSG